MRDEALKLALEALETERDIYRENDVEDGAPEYIYEAITAIKQALAAPVQEPVGEVSGHDWSTGLLYRDLEPGTHLYTASHAIPEQMPVIPKCWSLIAVTGFDELMYWMQRCEEKGHLENCPDLIEPYQAFDYQPITTPPAAQPAPVQEPVEMSPEFTDTARAALLWVLWHHQGGSSPVGQPIRFALGMGAHERLSAKNIAEAKRWASKTGSTTADFHTAPPAQPASVPTSWMDMVTANLVREGVNKHKARELAEHFYTTPPAAPKVVDCHANGVCVQSGLRAEMPAPVPLTDDQVDAATKAWFENDIVAGRYPFRKRMRAAFAAAHGITGKDQP